MDHQLRYIFRGEVHSFRQRFQGQGSIGADAERALGCLEPEIEWRVFKTLLGYGCIGGHRCMVTCKRFAIWHAKPAGTKMLNDGHTPLCRGLTCGNLSKTCMSRWVQFTVCKWMVLLDSSFYCIRCIDGFLNYINPDTNHQEDLGLYCNI